MNFFSQVSIDQFQAEAIARGLFTIAQVDGVHDREAALVAAFWAETGGTAGALSDLSRRDQMSAEELAQSLSGQDVRKLFVKTALLLCLADGKISDGERGLLTQYVGALGLGEAMPQLETEVKEFLLGHLSHVQNVEAVAQVAKDLNL